MANELTVTNLADQVREKVRQTIMNSIPDDQIDKLVKSEWNTFFERQQKSQWDSTMVDSPFQQMVRTETEKQIRARVNEAIVKELDQFQQATWEQNAKGALREMVKTYAPAVLEGMAQSMAAECLNRLQQQRGSF